MDATRIFWSLTRRQLGLVAMWQLIEAGVPRAEARRLTRRLERVQRGVYSMRELTDLGRLLAAVLSCGPRAAASHHSGLWFHAMRPHFALEVAVAGRGGRSRRDGLLIHRPCELECERRGPLTVTTPTRTLLDVSGALSRPALYRAIECAHRQQLELDDIRLVRNPILSDLLRLRAQVTGFTRSDSEAAFLLLCSDHGLELPLVNQYLNGCEADFHWPDHRLVVEVDGYEHHVDKTQFEEDRRRGIRHRGAGFEVIRASADQVWDVPLSVLQALLNARPALRRWPNSPRNPTSSTDLALLRPTRA